MESILYCFILVSIFLFKIKNDTKPVVSFHPQLNVDARSCIAMIANTHEIAYSKNIHEQLLPASITKILTCIVAIETYPMDDYVYITAEMINTIGSKIYIMEGDLISVQDLLYGLILNSGNDAAKAIAMHYSGVEEDFVHLMNTKAKAIGMKNSIFGNSSGLDADTKNLTTAYDMALLMDYALQNKTFRKIVGTKSYRATLPSGKKLYFHHKHRLVQNYDIVSGGKTGYTEKAGRTLITSFIQDHTEVIVVTFCSHNDWEIHMQLANMILNSNKQPRTLRSNSGILERYYPFLSV